MKIFRSEWKLLMLGVTSITFLLSSCEKDTNDIGVDFIPGKTTGNTASIDLVAYNISNNDSIRADYKVLSSGLIGIYEDASFGKSKASYTTQLNLNDTGILGVTQEVDSVVLSITPAYDESDKIVNGETIQYRLKSYLGNKNVSMNLAVNRINTDLGTYETKHFSNEKTATGDLLGTAVITDFVEKRNSSETPGYRIKLDGAYFKQHFFNKKGSDELSSSEKFIQYFKGIKISTPDNSSKFMFNFSKSNITLIAYYRYKDNLSEATYKTTSYSFVLNDTNSVLGEYEFDRSTASSQYNNQLSNPNIANGEEVLFLQGMGGPSIKLKLDDAQLSSVRDSIQNSGWIIIGAKLNFYLAEDAVSKPIRIYGYNSTQNSLLPDLTIFSSLPGYSFYPEYNTDLNPGYYTLNITEYFKNIVERNNANDDITVGIGTFLVSNNSYVGYYATSRAYEPYRLILHGNNTTSDKKLKLDIIYTKNNR